MSPTKTRRARRTWTLPELREAKAAFERGETWPSIGARYGVAPSTVRSQVTSQLGKPRRRNRPPPCDEATTLQAMRIRNTERLSWTLVRERVGYTGTAENLRIKCVRYSKRHKMQLFQGWPDVRLTKWDTEADRRPEPHPYTVAVLRLAADLYQPAGSGEES